MLRGGCYCRSVRYETSGTPTDRTNCHCSICRRLSAAPFVTWFTVPTADFRFVDGTPVRLQSSSHGTRSFCGQCGTPLTFETSAAPGAIDVTTCSLDDPEALPPEDEIETSSRLGWIEAGSVLPSFPGARS
ncbi:MAG: GFA family protein [Myxococcota bacterium]|nr:GFA family protein [Myxococcota bacterium]